MTSSSLQHPFLGKYLRVMSIGFQNTLVYRWNFLIRAFFGFLPLTCSFFLWNAFFGGDPDARIQGYAFSGMISYFLAMMLLDSLASPTEDDWQVAGEIRDGLISQFLLKPIDYLAYRFSLFLACRLVYTSTTILPALGMLFFLRQYLAFPEEPAVWLVTLPAVLLSAILQFLAAYCIALLAFWILEIGAPIFIIYSIELLAGGHVFPLDLLPGSLYRLLMWTPFAYEYWFPLGVFLGKFSQPEIWRGFILQITWIAIFYLLARWLWSRGIKHYSAVGG
ncbi:MAG: ABC-2 family transporter protein [Verrucomicrobiae bacterium]|nr:ABC-2 family transporter protein [Verrucomicrobiae bacterium]